MSKRCPSCNHELADDARFCNNCGAQQPQPAGPQAEYQRPGPQQGQPNSQAGGAGQPGQAGQAGGEVFTAEDVEKNKVISALAYLVFFLPLIAAPDSQFGKFHANQGLLLLIFSIIGYVVLGALPIIKYILVPLFSLLCAALFFIGLINTLNGKARELPLIGQYRIIR